MVDIKQEEIKTGAEIVFIHNKRGEKPRLAHGIVEETLYASIVVLEHGETRYHLHHSQRSYADGRLLRAVVIHPQADYEDGLLDCAGQPITEGCKVAFMEYPSQGFSGSLLLGEVLRIERDGLTIRDDFDGSRKYFRKANDIVVIDHFGL